MKGDRGVQRMPLGAPGMMQNPYARNLRGHSVRRQRTERVHALPRHGRNLDLLVAPQGDEQHVKSGANKFLRTDLEKIYKDKGVTTVIVTGTVAHGAVLNTAAAAALMGLKVILPVDGMSAENAYPEQYTAWHLANAPGGIAPQVTVTKIDLIQFGSGT